MWIMWSVNRRDFLTYKKSVFSPISTTLEYVMNILYSAASFIPIPFKMRPELPQGLWKLASYLAFESVQQN